VTIPLLCRLVSERHHQQHHRCEANAQVQHATTTGGRRARCLQHGSSTCRVRSPGSEGERLSAATQYSAICRPSPSPSPSRSAATPTSPKSSGLFDSSDDDRCRRAAGFNDEPSGEPLELIGQGGGRSPTSTLLPGYPGPPTNVIGRSKGCCWICDSPKHQKAFCPTWNKALSLANSRGTATGNPGRNPAAQPRVQRPAGAPQP
jgi:hypothetical protein